MRSNVIFNLSSVEIAKPVTCNIRNMAKVLLEDDEKKIKESGKWPLLIDTAGEFFVFQFLKELFVCILIQVVPNQ